VRWYREPRRSMIEASSLSACWSSWRSPWSTGPGASCVWGSGAVVRFAGALRGSPATEGPPAAAGGRVGGGLSRGQGGRALSRSPRLVWACSAMVRQESRCSRRSVFSRRSAAVSTRSVSSSMLRLSAAGAAGGVSGRRLRQSCRASVRSTHGGPPASCFGVMRPSAAHRRIVRSETPTRRAAARNDRRCGPSWSSPMLSSPVPQVFGRGSGWTSGGERERVEGSCGEGENELHTTAQPLAGVGVWLGVGFGTAREEGYAS